MPKLAVNILISSHLILPLLWTPLVSHQDLHIAKSNGHFPTILKLCQHIVSSSLKYFCNFYQKYTILFLIILLPCWKLLHSLLWVASCSSSLSLKDKMVTQLSVLGRLFFFVLSYVHSITMDLTIFYGFKYSTTYWWLKSVPEIQILIHISDCLLEIGTYLIDTCNSTWPKLNNFLF